jgi:PTS system nitrogen regulatory IIA component
VNKTLKEIISEKNILPDLKSNDREGVFTEIVEHLVSYHKGLKGDVIFQRLLEREKTSSTAIEHGVAFPHVRIPGLQEIIVAIGRSKVGIEFSSLDKKPTHIFVILLAPQGQDYLRVLAKFAKTLQNPERRETLMTASSAQEIARVLTL